MRRRQEANGNAGGATDAFNNATGAAESKGAGRALTRPRADELEVGRGGLRLSDDLRQ